VDEGSSPPWPPIGIRAVVVVLVAGAFLLGRRRSTAE
jgi:MYXO-CTERM domain-containing protein